MLAQLHGSLGLGPTLRYRGPDPTMIGELAFLVESDLGRLMRATDELVARHAPGTQAVADALCRRRFLPVDEIERIFRSHDPSAAGRPEPAGRFEQRAGQAT